MVAQSANAVIVRCLAVVAALVVGDLTAGAGKATARLNLRGRIECGKLPHAVKQQARVALAKHNSIVFLEVVHMRVERLLDVVLASFFVVIVLIMFPGDAGAAPAPPAQSVPAIGSSVYFPTVSQQAFLRRSSEELINEAVKQGAIGEETALMYQVFAEFGDPRLPEAYRGREELRLETSYLRQATSQWNALADATKEALLPFVTPPIYQGSWGDPDYVQQAAAEAAAPSGGSTTYTLEPIPCREGAQEALLPGWVRIELDDISVWYNLAGDPKWGTTPEETADAAYLVADVVEDVRTRMDALMGRSKPSDAGEPCNGGDDNFDIYVLRNTMYRTASTVAYPPGCELRPTFMTASPDQILNDPKAAEYVVAHEFMHTYQLGSYDYAGTCEETGWLDEATAHWAVDYLYPSNNREHQAAEHFMNLEHQASLEVGWSNGFNENTFGLNGYADYVFFLYLTRKLGNPNLIPRIYERLEDEANSLVAVNAEIPGGWKERWPEFALYAWNRSPVTYFRDWDGLTHEAAPMTLYPWAEEVEQDVRLGDKLQKDVKMGISYIPHLGIRYLHFRFPDPNVRSTGFYNGVRGNLEIRPMQYPGGPLIGNAWSLVDIPLEQREDIHIWGLYRLEGKSTWEQPENWTEKPFVGFCRDKQSERVAEMVVVYSNHEHLDREFEYLTQGVEPRMVVANIGCWRWEGESSWTKTIGGVVEKMAAKVTWERKIVDPSSHVPTLLVPVAGSATWTMEGASGACTVSGTATWPLGPDDGEMYLYDRIVSGPAFRGYGGRGQLDKEVTYTINCPGGSQVVKTAAGVWWEPPTGLDIEPYWLSVQEDGVTIDNSDSRVEGGFIHIDEERYLQALRE